MKKILILTLCLVFLVSVLISCGSAEKTPEETTVSPEQTSAQPNESESEPATEVTTTPSDEPTMPNPDDFDFYQLFAAPEGNPRDIVMNYMLEMAKVEWVASESWTTTWKETGDFKVSLSYEKGKTYYGVPYARTNAPLEEFLLFVNDGKFAAYPSNYYEEIVGNHCSSSMVMSFQQVLPMPYSGGLKPITTRTQYLRFPDGVEIPPSRTPNTKDDWISATVFEHNGQDAIMNGYAQLDKGDILYKSIDGSGHTRLVSKVEVSKSAAGKILPARSTISCVEQTNAWWDNNKNTTWWIDKKYTFSQLYDTYFMPVTFHMYHDEDFVIQDAYIAMDGKNSPDNIMKSLNGVITSNFPLAYARITIEDANGNIVSENLEYYLTNAFQISLRNMHYDLKLNTLPAGTYTYKLRAGIARGGCDIESFQFTIA